MRVLFRLLAVALAASLLGNTASGDVFNMGPGLTSLEMVPVGDPRNAGEVSGSHSYTRICGAVDYAYNIGTYEVTNAQYCEFLNAVATVGDPHGLYNTDMGGGWNDIGGISQTGPGTAGDPWVYSTRPNRANRPVDYVSWFDAARFANWLHNGQPTGVQDADTTENGAYDMSLGSGVVRNADALVFLPGEDEWYKAAYYKGGGTNAGYWDYATQSDTAPTAEPPAGTDMINGSANCYDNDWWGYIDPTYYTTEVGAYTAKPSDSTYGTYDQGGNLWEWNEIDVFGDGSKRGMRGGSFGAGDDYLHASWRAGNDPTSESTY